MCQPATPGIPAWSVAVHMTTWPPAVGSTGILRTAGGHVRQEVEQARIQMAAGLLDTLGNEHLSKSLEVMGVICMVRQPLLHLAPFGPSLPLSYPSSARAGDQG